MRLLKLLYRQLFFLSVGLCSVPTSAETKCNFILNPTTQKSLAEISSSPKSNLFFSNFITNHFVKVTEIKTFSEKAVIPKHIELELASSKENKWLGLLYLDENGKSAIHPNGAVLSQANQKIFESKDLVEAWKRVSDAIPTKSGTTTFAKDISTLERVSELSDATSAFRKKFPDTWESELSDLISKNSELRCTACGNMSSSNSLLSRLPSMDEMLENINHLAEYRDIPGFDNAYAAFKSNANNRDGINHMVKYMRNNTDELGGNITAFEFRYDDDLLRRADLAAGDKLYEFKSWTKNADQPWNGFFGGSGTSYDQFLDYLRNTDDLDNLRYVFNSGKATESEVKAAFKNLFENKKPDIFSTFSDDLKDVLELEAIADLNSTKIDEIIDVLVKVE